MSADLVIADISDADVSAVIDLWQRAGLTRPWNDPQRDIAFARQSTDATVLVGKIAGRVVATAMVGHDGHRGAYYYVASDPELRGQGLGRAIVAAAEAWLKDRGVWKANLIVRGDNLVARGFYEALGYAVEPNIQMSRRFEE